jgi:uncharacterized membrane protein
MAAVLLALMVGVLLLIAIEIRKWQTGRSLVSRRRFLLRMAGGALLWVLVAAVFVGIYILRLGSARGQPVLFLAFWLGCVVIAFVLMFLAVADMREVERQQTRHQTDLWREMARMIAGKPQPEEKPKQDGEGGPRAT